MSRSFLYRSLALVAALCILWGAGKSAALRFHQQRQELLKVAVAEQRRLGLTNRTQLLAKYPTPEITFCKVIDIEPGATAEVVLPGKYVAGSRFLYENDAIEVVKDSVTASEYRATIRAATDATPCLAAVHGFSPVSAAAASCDAVRIGGIFEGQFSAANGWAVRLIPQERKKDDNDWPYLVEFTKRGESRPFEKFPGVMRMEDSCSTGKYEVELRVKRESVSSPGGVEEYQRLAQQMQKPGITPQEYEKLLQRMTELATQMQKSMESTNQKVMENAEQANKLEMFGCKKLEFTVNGGAASGDLNCRDANGSPQPVKITGTLRKVAR